MSPRYLFRATALAAVTVFTGVSAQAIEATQWNPQEESARLAAIDATLTPNAWTAENREATQFHDARSRDDMTARSAVRSELQQARTRGLLNDTGEAGASERVLAQREAFVAAEHERLVALNAAPARDDDPIAAIADAAMTDDMRDSEAMTESGVSHATMALTTDEDAPLPYESSVTTLAMAPNEDRMPAG